MSSGFSAPYPARIEKLSEIPILILSGRHDTSTKAAMDGLVASPFTQHNLRILKDRHGVTFLRRLGQRSIFKLVKHVAVCGRAAAFSILPMFAKGIEIWGFPGLLNIFLDHRSAPTGGRS